MTSERFQHTLKDLKDVFERKGLAQDTTSKEHIRTQIALISTVYRIGREDGMNDNEIKKILDKEYLEPTLQKLESKTLLDDIAAILGPIKSDKNGASELDNVTADLPHDVGFAYTMVDTIREKYEACTEREKREITRSDIEFIHLIMTAVAQRCGFKDIKDCFDIDESEFNIPKIPRANELIWSNMGDPDPKVSEEDKIFHSKIKELVSEIVEAFYHLYPETYAKIMYHYEGGKLVLNTSRVDNEKISRLLKESDSTEFRAFVIPILIDALVISFLTRKEYYMNNHKREGIRKNLIETVLKSKK